MDLLGNKDKKCGYLYVAMGKRYLQEVEISARSLKRFTTYPVCLVTDDTDFKCRYIDLIIYSQTETDFAAKIIGIKKTPFRETIFLDSDTFICSSIDHLFDVLELFDMALSVENFMHSYGYIQHYNPGFKIKYEKTIPEYNTGVIVYRWNRSVQKLMEDWISLHKELKFKVDMPSFREALIKNADGVKISPLPFEYNYHGTHSFGFVYNEIRVIHERLGEKRNTLTTVMLPFEKMDRIAKRINKITCKRLIIPYIGVIPYSYSPYNIRKKIKRFFGVRYTKKSETFY